MQKKLRLPSLAACHKKKGAPQRSFLGDQYPLNACDIANALCYHASSSLLDLEHVLEVVMFLLYRAFMAASCPGTRIR